MAKQYAGTQRSDETYVAFEDEPRQLSPREAVCEMEGADYDLVFAWPTVKLSSPDLFALDVAASMAGKERDMAPIECSDNVSVRRFSEGRGDPHFTSLFQARHMVKTAATNDSNLCFGQTSSSAANGRDSSN